MGLVLVAQTGQAEWVQTSRGNGSIANGNNQLTCPTGNFVAADVGKEITIPGAGAAGATIVTRINAVSSSTVVTVNTFASTTVSGVAVTTASRMLSTAGANFEIWRFNDTLQSTVPVFIKVEYVNESGTANPGLAISVGFSVDGLGNLGAQNSGRIYMNTTNFDSSSTAYSCYFSGDTNRIAFVLRANHSTTRNTLFVSVERTKDSAGADTGAGVLLAVANGGTSTLIQHASVSGAQPVIFMMVPFTGSMPNPERRFPCILSTHTSGSSAYGTTIGAGTAVPMAGTPLNPGMNFLIGLAADFTAFTNYTIPVYGTNHNYYQIGSNWGMIVPGQQASDPAIAARILMRYE